MGHHQPLPRRRPSRGRRLGNGRDLLLRGRRRQRIAQVGRGADLRTGGHRRSDDSRIPVHPQHVRVDGGPLRHHRAAQGVGAAAGVGGGGCQLLSDRAVRGVRCGSAAHQGGARRDRLRARRRQAIHLRRRLVGRLHHSGPNRRRWTARHLGVYRREGHCRAEFRRAGAEDGLACPADRAGDPRGGPGARGGDAGRRRRRGIRIRDCDERAQRWADQHRGVLAGWRADRV